MASTTATVILIGHQANNRLDPALTDPITRSKRITSVLACSPFCHPTSAVVLSPDASSPSGYRVGFDNTEQAKPAECYVLQFATGTDARDWLSQDVPAVGLVGKKVLLIDPSTAS